MIAAAIAAVFACTVSAHAIARAQSGPSWEVPVAVVSLLLTSQVVALGSILIAVAFGVAAFRAARPGSLAIAILFMLLAAAIVLTLLATPEFAGQWPVKRPRLSAIARASTIPVALVSLGLGVAVVRAWIKSSARGA
jgi:hypothetical protein